MEKNLLNDNQTLPHTHIINNNNYYENFLESKRNCSIHNNEDKDCDENTEHLCSCGSNFFSWCQEHAYNPCHCYFQNTSGQSAVVVQPMVFSNGKILKKETIIDTQKSSVVSEIKKILYPSEQTTKIIETSPSLEMCIPPYILKGFFCEEGLYGSGVFFTRNPTTGDDELFGEFLPNSQGDLLVSGEKTPMDLLVWLQKYPHVLAFFQKIKSSVEQYYKFPQDMEFSIENGYLFFLQTRSIKMSLNALGKVLESLVLQEMITLEEAYEQLSHGDLNTIDTCYIKNIQDMHLVASGQDLGSGAVSGPLLWDIYNEEQLKKISLKDSIVFTPYIHPDIIPLLLQVKGVLCSQGGITSHGALILRSMGKVCVLNVPCSLEKNKNNQEEVLKIGDYIFHQGDNINLENGNIYKGKGSIESYPGIGPSLDFFIKKVSKTKNSHIFVNADSPEDIEKAILQGARGVGLVRSEHMMLFPHILPLFRRLILGRYQRKSMEKERQEFIDIHSQDIAKILKASKGLPVTFRLLDPPLHEFFPEGEVEQKILSQDLEIPYDETKKLLDHLKEYNPMMALRGIRLGLAYPDFYRDQCTAMEKALTLCHYPEKIRMMIPFVNHPLELIRIKELVPELLQFSLGIMIETPRACIVSWILAKGLDFISFGTNDLSQGTWCLSRDDQKSLQNYWNAIGEKINPFDVFDRRGTGSLMAMACAQLRQHFPNISLSVCGDHAGQWNQRDFFESLGITILSCSPRRILPMALGLKK